MGSSPRFCKHCGAPLETSLYAAGTKANAALLGTCNPHVLVAMQATSPSKRNDPHVPAALESDVQAQPNAMQHFTRFRKRTPYSRFDHYRVKFSHLEPFDQICRNIPRL